MKRISMLGTPILILALMLATRQAMARSLAVNVGRTGNPHKTGTPAAGTPAVDQGAANTPGAKATEQAGKHGLRGKPEILRGMLASVDASSMTITLADGTSATVAITPDT